MATFGRQLPKIMTIPPIGEAMAQCRVELVRRESELIAKIIKEGSGVFGKSHAQAFLVETRLEIARIDALFSVETKIQSQPAL